MGSGTAGAVAALTADGVSSWSDEELVAAIRRGEDRAFEVLYHRYHRRIHAYVLGMVKDHGRAEDVTQEVFVSALRRMRETEQALAFKPWLYQIAKNSCIDAFRRSRRTEEVSYDADDALAPSDHSRLVGSGPSPDAAVAAKQDLESLCGAFGGLSETHHEILVLRELEGLSYQEIGRRMGMSRPAVESTLFRARRRLSEEYDDIVSGARCLRIQGIITMAASTRLGARDTRRLARHLAHCQPCRREALAAGLDRNLFTRPTMRERAARKVASILPFPIFTRLRRGADGAPPPEGGGRLASWASQLPLLSDQLQSGLGRATAGAALLVAGVGAGVGVHHVAVTSQPSTASAAAARSSQTVPAHHASSATPDRATILAPAGAALPRRAATATATATAAVTRHKSSKHDAGGSEPSAATGRSTSAGGGSTHPAAAREAAKASPPTSGSGSATKRRPVRRIIAPAKAIATPVGTAAPGVTGTVRDAAQKTTDAVNKAAEKVTSTVNNATSGTPVAPAVATVTGTVDKAADQVGKTANQTVGQVAGALNPATGGGG